MGKVKLEGFGKGIVYRLSEIRNHVLRMKVKRREYIETNCSATVETNCSPTVETNCSATVETVKSVQRRWTGQYTRCVQYNFKSSLDYKSVHYQDFNEVSLSVTITIVLNVVIFKRRILN